jgi:GNAT superfamily N-acetyltransferase
MGPAGRAADRNRPGDALARRERAAMALLDDVITYLEMREPPATPRLPAPFAKLALMQTHACTVSFYRYLYETVGTPWLWYERRLYGDGALAAEIGKPTTEIFVLYAGGVPAGYFELDAASPHETELCYFGLVPEFIGRGLGPFLLRAAIDRAWSRPIGRLWVHTRTFDHPKALGYYQRAGFVVYARQKLRFEDPRIQGILPRTLTHPLLPPLE